MLAFHINLTNLSPLFARVIFFRLRLHAFPTDNQNQLTISLISGVIFFASINRHNFIFVALISHK